MDIVDKMRQRIFDIIDPNVDYTQEDFDEEFGNIDYTTNSGSNFKLNINFVNKSTNPNPEYATSGSSGFDLRANLEKPYVLESKKFTVIPTGLYFEIPESLEIQIRARSSLAIKHGITVLNGIGTIDSDYTGEIGVILINHGKDNFVINHGDRIAQGIISSVFNKALINFNKINSITKITERGSGGYGSTGYK
jgi:dUTP pyrophosphatase